MNDALELTRNLGSPYDLISIEDAFDMAMQSDSAFDLAGFFAHHLFDGTFCALRKPRT